MPIVNDHTALLSGTYWNGIEQVATPVIITYSFPTALPDYVAAADANWTPAALASFSAFTAAEQQMARDALAEWGDASGLIFVEVAAGSGDINFSKMSFTGTGYEGAGGVGFRPFGDWDFFSFPHFTSDLDYAGDVFMNTDFALSYETLLHEIGHTLGFKHPTETATSADGVLHDEVLASDDPNLTIMAQTGGGTGHLTALDIAAVQAVYGTQAQDGAQVSSWSFDVGTQTLTQTALAAGGVIRGVSVDDIIIGGAGADRVFALNGNDSVTGAGGNDTLFGGPGNDTLQGGADNDTLWGQAGQDSLEGGSGNDQLDGGLGQDTLLGGDGDDSLYLRAPADLVAGEIYDGGNHDFSLSFGDTLLVTGNGSFDLTTVTLSNLETLSATDASITLSTAQFSGFTDIFVFDALGTLNFADDGDVTLSPLSRYGTINLAAGGQTLDASAVNDGGTINGGSGDDLILTGTAPGLQVSTVNAGAGNDTVIGSASVDSIAGGLGNDTVTTGGGADVVVLDPVDSVAQVDVVTDFSLAAGDRVDLGNLGPASWEALNNAVLRSSGADAQLLRMWGGNAQTLTLTGVTVAAIQAANNDTSAPNFIFDTSGTSRVQTGTGQADHLFGGLGGDTLDGGSGNDTIYGDAGADSISGDLGNDTLFGGAGDDTVSGGDGNDRLYGQAGNDTLRGGNGNDVYYVTDADDVVDETGTTGDDFIQSTVDYILAAGQAIEGLAVQVADGRSLTGNELANYLYGNVGNDTLDGGGGNDTFEGSAGSDEMRGGSGDDLFHIRDAGDTIVELGGGGNDTAYVYTSWTANDGAHVDTIRSIVSGLTVVGNDQTNIMRGSAGNDTIDGGAGNDRLYGHGGNDEMRGGLGDDIFYVTDIGDVVVEGADAGRDWVQTIVDFTLGQNVEGAQIITGIGRQLTGNDLGNELRGNVGSDTIDGGIGGDDLYGSDGADRLIGGAGNDRQTGGADSDTFVFADGWGADLIVDFQDNVDTLDLSAVTGLDDLSQMSVLQRTPTDFTLSFGGNSIRIRGDVTLATIQDDLIL